PLRLFAFGVELFLAEVVGVRVAGIQELVRRLGIEVIALRLKVGAERAADFGALVPGDAEPAEAVEDGLQGLGTVALGVGVVDAQAEGAPLRRGQQPVKQRGADPADVQIAGGTGGEAGADRHARGGPGGRGCQGPRRASTVKGPLYRPTRPRLP